MCRNFDRIVNEIRTEGILEGVNKGVEKERLNTIERLYLMNVSIDMIAPKMLANFITDTCSCV